MKQNLLLFLSKFKVTGKENFIEKLTYLFLKGVPQK